MKVLLLNQAFWPDVVASAQQLTMLARRLSERGHQVTVITSRRGYDDPSLVFEPRERWHSIEIIRISSFAGSKRRRWQRALNFASYLFTCAMRLTITARADVVIALTSPPLISWLGALFVRAKGGRLIFWPLDLNPDEAIAAGWLKQESLAARFLARLLMSSMKAATKIIALDESMKARIVAKGIPAGKIEVVAPAPDDSVRYDQEGREQFRQAHDLNGKFVVMYAGNHSPCHPLDTLLHAARKLHDRSDILFVFAGGGSELAKVRSFSTEANIRCLPYQPQAQLSNLLSAADLHVVVMGEGFSGIVHPSKIYNLLKIGSPLLYIGPEACFISDLIAGKRGELIAVSARHGDPQTIVDFISRLADSERRDRSIQTTGEDGLIKFIAHIEAAATDRPSSAALEALQT